MLPKVRNLVSKWCPVLCQTAEQRFTSVLLETTHPSMFPPFSSMSEESAHAVFVTDADVDSKWRQVPLPKVPVMDRKVQYLSLASSMGFDVHM